MASCLEKRLTALESQAQATDPADKKRAQDRFYSRLTLDELRWLLEPAHEARGRVPCVHHEEASDCACSSDERANVGLEKNPAYREDFARRLGVRQERVDEILARPRPARPEEVEISRAEKHLEEVDRIIERLTDPRIAVEEVFALVGRT